MERNVDIEAVRNRHIQSSMNIKSMDLKNRRKRPYFPITVVDEFFPEPELWRYFGLQQEFTPAETETYPGIRTIPLNEINHDLFDKFAMRLLSHMPKGVMGFQQLRASFHLTDETFIKGWIHDDDPQLSVSGLVYLSPNPPKKTGTIFFEDTPGSDPGLEFTEIIEKDTLEFTAEQRLEIGNYRDKHRQCYSQIADIENVYNRCIMFDPRLWHCPDNFFGKTKEEARLTLVWTAVL